MANRKTYRPLTIDFEIPGELQRSIDLMVEWLNRGELVDVLQDDIRATLNGCEFCMTEEQIETIRRYYCRGGIYANAE